MIQAVDIANMVATALTMPNNACIMNQSIHVVGVESGDFVKVELAEGAAEMLTFAQNGEPAQAGLKALQTDLLEQALVAFDWVAPFVIMIGDVIGVATMPPAAFYTIGFGR